MRSGGRLAGVALGVACGAALSCGEVPTLPDGLAYISTIVSPALAVAAGDSLRDSTGKAAPLRVYAFGRDGDTLPGIAVNYLVTSLDAGVTIDANGMLRATDSVRSVRIVGQVLDRLQTPEFTLQVVTQPDSLHAALLVGVIQADSTLPPLASAALDMTVSRGNPATGVQAIVVRYEITRIAPAGASTGAQDTTFALVDPGTRRFKLGSPQLSLDTTAADGLASRRVRVTSDGFDTVFVTVRATNLRGQPLHGSPAVITLVHR